MRHPGLSAPHTLHTSSMTASSTPFSPLYEPGAPPPPLPLLTAQTDLNNPLRSSTLTNAEVLPKGAASQTNRRHMPVLSQPSPTPPCGGSPSGSDASDMDSDSSTDSDDSTIPKPAGEAGWPGRGGYNLEVALDWDPKAFKKLKVRFINCIKLDLSRNDSIKAYVHRLIKENLDTTKCYSSQSLSELQAVCRAVRLVLNLILHLIHWPCRPQTSSPILTITVATGPSRTLSNSVWRAHLPSIERLHGKLWLGNQVTRNRARRSQRLVLPRHTTHLPLTVCTRIPSLSVIASIEIED